MVKETIVDMLYARTQHMFVGPGSFHMAMFSIYLLYDSYGARDDL